MCHFAHRSGVDALRLDRSGYAHLLGGAGQWRIVTSLTAGELRFSNPRTPSGMGLGRYVLRILRGEAPGSISMAQAERFELLVNHKAARALGLELPMMVLARADGVLD